MLFLITFFHEISRENEKAIILPKSRGKIYFLDICDRTQNL